eukprot:2452973-Prymnesium_polylepis.1
MKRVAGSTGAAAHSPCERVLQPCAWAGDALGGALRGGCGLRGPGGRHGRRVPPCPRACAWRG